MKTVTQKRIPCLSTQRQKGPDCSPPNRSRHNRHKGSCRAGQQGSGKARGRRSQLLWVHGSSPRASPGGRHHVRMGTCAPRTTQEGTKEPSGNRRQHAACSGGSGQRQPEPSHRRSRPHLGKGWCPRGASRLQRSAFRGSDAQAHKALLRPRAHTGLPVLGGGHPADAGNRTGMRDRTSPAARLRETGTSAQAEEARPGSSQGSQVPHPVPATGGPRCWRCWRPEPLLQTSPVPAPAPPPHNPPAGPRCRPPGAPLPRTGLDSPAAGGRRGPAGERTEGRWGSEDQPPAAGPTGRRADTPSAQCPRHCSSCCRQDPSRPDRPGDPGPSKGFLGLDLQGGKRPGQQSGCCVPTALRGSRRTRNSHPWAQQWAGACGVHSALLETLFHGQGGPHDASQPSSKHPGQGHVQDAPPRAEWTQLPEMPALFWGRSQPLLSTRHRRWEEPEAHALNALRILEPKIPSTGRNNCEPIPTEAGSPGAGLECLIGPGCAHRGHAGQVGSAGQQCQDTASEGPIPPPTCPSTPTSAATSHSGHSK